MKKLLHIFVYIFFVFYASAQENLDSEINTLSYYQSIDLDAETPCNCNEKTDKVKQLYKGVVDKDFYDNKLHAYHFSYGNSINAFSKLFQALENDPSVIKISMNEWNSFMLFTTDKFDSNSFEKAAKKAFVTFYTISPDDYLLKKNADLFATYKSYKLNIQESNQSK